MHLRRGPATSADLQARFGVSQPVMSRVLAILQRAGLVIGFGKARATRYAALRDVAGMTAFPITRIDENGAAHRFGNLRCIAPDAYLFTDSEERQEVFDGLPWFVADMRPQGFLGRSFPKLHPELDLPQRVIDWTDDQALIALAFRGEDNVGDLVIGDESLRRYMQEPPVEVSSRGCVLQYERFAADALAGTPPGSSAGGEQPKFAVALRHSKKKRHVLVKFTDRSGSPVDRRMRDLLICESAALDVLAKSTLGLTIPRHRLIEGPHRVFLEIERFDRTGRGRLGVSSLLAVDSHFVGHMTTWSGSAARLRDRRLISSEDAQRIVHLESFGRLIGNTDMHYGNLAFFRGDPPDAVPLRLAPVYDQLPMLYAPVAGRIVARQLGDTRLAPAAEGVTRYRETVALASRFWTRVSVDERVSRDFREIAAANAMLVGAIAGNAQAR